MTPEQKSLRMKIRGEIKRNKYNSNLATVGLIGGSGLLAHKIEGRLPSGAGNTLDYSKVDKLKNIARKVVGKEPKLTRPPIERKIRVKETRGFPRRAGASGITIGLIAAPFLREHFNKKTDKLKKAYDKAGA